jgi:hypothetical protein
MTSAATTIALIEVTAASAASAAISAMLEIEAWMLVTWRSFWRTNVCGPALTLVARSASSLLSTHRFPSYAFGARARWKALSIRRPGPTLVESAVDQRPRFGVLIAVWIAIDEVGIRVGPSPVWASATTMRSSAFWHAG